MSLTVLKRGTRSSLFTLSDSCYTKQNYGLHPNSTLSVNTPIGVLGGSVAAISAGLDYTAVPGTSELLPIGLFINDAAGDPFEINFAISTGKIAVMMGGKAVVEVDVYETRNAANTNNLVYSVGDRLYSSANGLLTNEVSTEGTVVGIVVKSPSLSSPTIGLLL
jgi:hypothetical protein